MNEGLKHQISRYLLIVFFLEVSSYVITNVAYMSGFMEKFVAQSSFYTVALFMPFLFGWIFFFVPYVLIRKCEKCGSKNIRSSFPEKGLFICDDCDYVFEPNLQKNTKTIILLIAVPFLFLGPCISLGAILAGETIPMNIIRNGVLFSSLMPSAFAVLIYSAKLMDRSTFFHRHTILVFMVLFILIPLFFSFILFTFDAIIVQILERII